jgi:P4 family phage/plasmid primase-like protien
MTLPTVSTRSAIEFLQTLFGDKLPEGQYIEIRSVPGKYWLIDSPAEVPPITAHVNWYFGVCTRDQHRKPVAAPCVWLDLDTSQRPLIPPSFAPSVTVYTGRGWHFYWKLRRLVEPQDAVGLSRLLAYIFSGDSSVCEPARVMRLPGSVNVKYDTKPVVTATYSPEEPWDFQKLFIAVLSHVIAPYWTEGRRHQLALGLPVLLSKYGLDFATKLVSEICRSVGDTEISDRLRAVEDTFHRLEQGELVSTFDVANILGKDLTDVLRRISHAEKLPANSIIYESSGEVLGSVHRAEEVIADHIVSSSNVAVINGMFAYWNGTNWRSYQTFDDFFNKLFVDVIPKYIVTTPKGAQQVAYKSSAVRLPVLKAMLAGALSETLITPVNGFAFMNGTLLLNDSTGEFKFKPTHDQLDFLQFILPFSYDESASAPTWEQFLVEAMPDEDLRRELQKWSGYLFVEGNPLERMLLIYGPTMTGKSTFLNTIATVLGEAAWSVSSTNITHTYSIANFAGRRLVYASELTSAPIDSTLLKQLVSCDFMEARHIYGRPFQFRFTGKIILATNEVPDLTQFEGMQRRLHVIYFFQQPKNPDPLLRQKLQQELPGIFNWMLEGWQIVVREHLLGGKPWVIQSSAEFVQEYTHTSDHVRAFFEESFRLDEAYETPYKLDTLYMQYVVWCRDHGFVPMPRNGRFTAALHRFGFKRAEMWNQKRIWLGPPMVEAEFGK